MVDSPNDRERGNVPGGTYSAQHKQQPDGSLHDVHSASLRLLKDQFQRKLYNKDARGEGAGLT